MLATRSHSITRLCPTEVLLTEVITEKFLHIVGRSTEVLGSIEVNHIVWPARVLLMREYWRKASQLADIGVFLHTQHIDGFTQGTVHITILAVGSTGIGCIFTIIDTNGTTITIILVVVVTHPRMRAIIVFIHQIHRTVEYPFRIVRSPCLHVADDGQLWILGMNGIVELSVTTAVLSTSLWLSVLVAHLNEFQSIWLRVTIGDTLTSPLGGLVSIGILDGIQGILNQGIHLFIRNGKTMSQTYIDHKHWGCAQVLAELEILIISQAIRRTILPVIVPVSWALLDRTDGFLPLEGIVVIILTFHIASTREAKEGWFSFI